MLYTYVNEEEEDKDPVGPRDAMELFKEAAMEVGLIRPGDPLDRNVVDFARLVVEICASIGDNYVQPESAHGVTVGDSHSRGVPSPLMSPVSLSAWEGRRSAGVDPLFCFGWVFACVGAVSSVRPISLRLNQPTLPRAASPR